MDDIYRITMLMDLYGPLVPERQMELMNLHYNEDCSLAEIAEQYDISRQGVYDFIRKARISLESYEQKLGLLRKYEESKKRLRHISAEIQEISREALDEADMEKLTSAEVLLNELIETI